MPKLQWLAQESPLLAPPKFLWTPAGKLAFAPACCCGAPTDCETTVPYVEGIDDECEPDPWFASVPYAGCISAPGKKDNLCEWWDFFVGKDLEIELPSGWVGSCPSPFCSPRPCDEMDGEILVAQWSPIFGSPFGFIRWVGQPDNFGEPFCSPCVVRRWHIAVDCLNVNWNQTWLPEIIKCRLYVSVRLDSTNHYQWWDFFDRQLVIDPNDPLSTWEMTLPLIFKEEDPASLCKLTGSPPVKVRVHM